MEVGKGNPKVFTTDWPAHFLDLARTRNEDICDCRLMLSKHNPQSNKSKKCWNNFLIAHHFFESSFATSTYFTNVESGLSFFHVPILKFCKSKFGNAVGPIAIPREPKIRYAFKVNTFTLAFSLENQRWGQEILMIAHLILRDLIGLKNSTKFTTDRRTNWFWRCLMTQTEHI